MIVWSGGVNVSIGELLSDIYTGNVKFHLYFLYLYVAFLLIQPFIKGAVCSMNRKIFLLMLCLMILFDGMLPIIQIVFLNGRITISGNIRPGILLSNIVFYPAVGHYLWHKREMITKKQVIYLWISNMIFILLSCYVTWYKGLLDLQYSEALSQTFHNSFVSVNAIAIYLTSIYFYNMRDIPSNKIKGFLACAGKSTFGVYLIHILVRNHVVGWKVLGWMIEKGFGKFPSVIFQCIEIFAVSSAMVMAVSLLPGIRKLFGYK